MTPIRFSIRTGAVAALFALAWCGPTAAQVRTFGYGQVPVPYAPRLGAGYGYGYGYGGTTPYAENARGVASVLRAKGDYNQNTAAALKDYEQARSTYIDNQVDWLKAYQQRKQMGEEYRDQEQAEERAALQRYQEHQREQQPEMLGTRQLDTGSGNLAFPSGLKAAAFDEDRDRLQDLFAIRSHSGSSSDLNIEIQTVVGRMLSTLKGLISTMPPQQYLDARNFLERARNEAAYG